MKAAVKRSLVKTVTWRLLGSTDTFVVSYLVTGGFETALTIGGIGLVTKMIMYFIHENVWGHKKKEERTVKRSAFKTVTWRMIGSLDTFIISLFVVSEAATAGMIGGIGFFTKSALYFLHERLWNNIVIFKQKPSIEDDVMEPGYVLAPYTIQERTGPSDESYDEYDKFMAEYEKMHEACPKCGSLEHSTTLVGYILDLSKPEEFKDENRCTCGYCGDIHSKHDRVS